MYLNLNSLYVYLIQNLNLERYIVEYMVGELVLKRDFRTNIRRYTSQNLDFKYGHPHSTAFLHFRLEL